MSLQDQAQAFDSIEWSGLGMPILKGLGGYFAPKTEEDLIWSSLLMILGTTKGARVMLPEFGSGVFESVFDPNDQVLHDNIRSALQNDVTRWDPRINIVNVDLSSGGSDGTALNILVRFSIVGRRGFTTKGFAVKADSFKLPRSLN